MSAETRTQRFTERTIRQVRSDCSLSMVQARYCPERSNVLHHRCVDDREETEQKFGSQLWYFEGVGVDESGRPQNVFGAVEYSLQFGLHELVEAGVFESEHERHRFRQLYERELHCPTWRHPGHRWLAAAMVVVASVFIAFLLVRHLAA